MKQNKQPWPQNPKRRDGLTFQVRGPWASLPTCGVRFEGGDGGAVQAVYVFKLGAGSDVSVPRFADKGRMRQAF